MLRTSCLAEAILVGAAAIVGHIELPHKQRNTHLRPGKPRSRLTPVHAQLAHAQMDVGNGIEVDREQLAPR